MVIPAKYDTAWGFQDRKAQVETDGLWFEFDREGNTVHDRPLTNEYKPFFNYSIAKFGYEQNDSVVIAAKYDDAGDFSEGLAYVKINDKYGFIDKTGAVVIPAKYDDAGYFNEGRAKVQINDKWDYINKKGVLVIPAKYIRCFNFKDGKAFVEANGLLFYIDRHGNKLPW